MIRIYLVEDHFIVTEGLRILLGMNSKYKVVGESPYAEKLLEEIDSLKVDLIITDLTLPTKSGIELIKQLREQQNPVKILVLTMHDNEAIIKEVFEAGANGYLLKHSDREELYKAIDTIIIGQNFCGESVMRTIAGSLLNRKEKEEAPVISKREKEIIEMLAKGFKTAEIAETLSLSTKTIDGCRASVMIKLNVKNSSELVAKAINLGIIK